MGRNFRQRSISSPCSGGRLSPAQKDTPTLSLRRYDDLYCPIFHWELSSSRKVYATLK